MGVADDCRTRKGRNGLLTSKYVENHGVIALTETGAIATARLAGKLRATCDIAGHVIGMVGLARGIADLALGPIDLIRDATGPTVVSNPARGIAGLALGFAHPTALSSKLFSYHAGQIGQVVAAVGAYPSQIVGSAKGEVGEILREIEICKRNACDGRVNLDHVHVHLGPRGDDVLGIGVPAAAHHEHALDVGLGVKHEVEGQVVVEDRLGSVFFVHVRRRLHAAPHKQEAHRSPVGVGRGAHNGRPKLGTVKARVSLAHAMCQQRRDARHAKGPQGKPDALLRQTHVPSSPYPSTTISGYERKSSSTRP